MSKGILQVHPPICDCPGCRISSPVVRSSLTLHFYPTLCFIWQELVWSERFWHSSSRPACMWVLIAWQMLWFLGVLQEMCSHLTRKTIFLGSNYHFPPDKQISPQPNQGGFIYLLTVYVIVLQYVSSQSMATLHVFVSCLNGSSLCAEVLAISCDFMMWSSFVKDFFISFFFYWLLC